MAAAEAVRVPTDTTDASRRVLQAPTLATTWAARCRCPQHCVRSWSGGGTAQTPGLPGAGDACSAAGTILRERGGERECCTWNHFERERERGGEGGGEIKKERERERERERESLIVNKRLKLSRPMKILLPQRLEERATALCPDSLRDQEG